MKFNDSVSSSRRKQRKAHFASDSTSRRKLMSAHLSKDMKKKYNVRLKGAGRARARAQESARAALVAQCCAWCGG